MRKTIHKSTLKFSEGIPTGEFEFRDLIELNNQEVGRASIVIFAPDGPEVLDLSPPEELLIGRGQTADLCIHDPSISRRHARLGWQDDRLFVEDLSSHNGTWVGGVRVERAYLSSGDVVRVGSVRLIVAIKSPSPGAEPPETTKPGA